MQSNFVNIGHIATQAVWVYQTLGMPLALETVTTGSQRIKERLCSPEKETEMGALYPLLNPRALHSFMEKNELRELVGEERRKAYRPQLPAFEGYNVAEVVEWLHAETRWWGNQLAGMVQLTPEQAAHADALIQQHTHFSRNPPPAREAAPDANFDEQMEAIFSGVSQAWQTRLEYGRYFNEQPSHTVRLSCPLGKHTLSIPDAPVDALAASQDNNISKALYDFSMDLSKQQRRSLGGYAYALGKMAQGSRGTDAFYTAREWAGQAMALLKGSYLLENIYRAYLQHDGLDADAYLPSPHAEAGGRLITKNLRGLMLMDQAMQMFGLHGQPLEEKHFTFDEKRWDPKNCRPFANCLQLAGAYPYSFAIENHFEAAVILQSAAMALSQLSENLDTENDADKITVFVTIKYQTGIDIRALKETAREVAAAMAKGEAEPEAVNALASALLRYNGGVAMAQLIDVTPTIETLVRQAHAFVLEHADAPVLPETPTAARGCPFHKG